MLLRMGGFGGATSLCGVRDRWRLGFKRDGARSRVRFATHLVWLCVEVACSRRVIRIRVRFGRPLSDGAFRRSGLKEGLGGGALAAFRMDVLWVGV